MKKILTSIAFLFFLLSLQGQPGAAYRQKSAEEMAQEKAAMVSERVGLDEKQYAQVYKLYLAQSRDLFKGMQGDTRSPEGLQGRGPGGMRGGPGGGGPGGGGPGMMGGGPGGGRPQGGPLEGVRGGTSPEAVQERIAPGVYEEPEKSVKKREKKMKKILSAQQFDQWTAIEKEMKYQRFREDFMKLEPDGK